MVVIKTEYFKFLFIFSLIDTNFALLNSSERNAIVAPARPTLRITLSVLLRCSRRTVLAKRAHAPGHKLDMTARKSHGLWFTGSVDRLHVPGSP